MAEEVVATFAGPLNSLAINLSITNSTAGAVLAVGLSGRTAKFPVTWDTFGGFGGPATLISVVGTDTEVVTARFNGFTSGETVTFTGIDPDFTGDVNSGVRVLDLEGAKFIAYFADGTSGFGVFAADDSGVLRATASK